MAIIDRRNISMGGNDKRKVSNISGIAVHYSATSVGHTASFENHWKNSRGWNTGGYHEVVLLNGDVELNYNPDTISNGVYGHNSVIYNICYVGNGVPNDKQLITLKERVKLNMNRFKLSASKVKGHREFSGQSTSCPALDMGAFRKSLNASGAGSTSKPKPQKPPKQTNKANLTVDGKWGNSTTRALQKALGTVQDGIISKQYRNSVTTQFYGNTIQFGSGGSLVIKALQKKVGVKQDGLLGPATIKALQKHLGTVQDGKLSRPSLVVKELQSKLNAGKF